MIRRSLATALPARVLYFVYELRDPRAKPWRPETLAAAVAAGLDPRAFYVGKSKIPWDRLSQHITEARRSADRRCSCPKCHVIRKILAEGLRPDLVRVTEFESEAEAMAAERRHAARFPAGRLTNTAEPGESGWSHSPETRQRISVAHSGRLKPPETAARIAHGIRLASPLGLDGRRQTIERLQAGDSPRAIARHFGVGTKHIEKIRRDAWIAGDLARPEPHVRAMEKLVALFRSGMIPEEVEQALGLTEGGVAGLLYQARCQGLLPRGRFWPRQSIRRGKRAVKILETLAWREKGLILDAVAEQVGTDQDSVVRWLRDGQKILTIARAGMTMADLGKEFNTSAETIEQIVEKAARIADDPDIHRHGRRPVRYVDSKPERRAVTPTGGRLTRLALDQAAVPSRIRNGPLRDLPSQT